MADNHPYYQALALVLRIDERLERGIHYRTRTGQLITTLDQAVTAILTNNFPDSGDTNGKTQTTTRHRSDLSAG
jgi:hypothetical protein